MKADVLIDRMYRIGAIDPRLYGSFVEHLGRGIYGGIYEPDHPASDADGFRQDVLDLVRDLDVPLIRYPGGNFVSAYNWEDGIGPRDTRPTRLDLAWKTTESNEIGINEFADWASRAGSELMMAVNLGTRGVDAARNLLEYSNHAGGSYWSDLRRSHGYADPHDIRLWCLGNEMDGDWQTGHKTAEEYGRLAAECARAMKQYDESLEFVVCGSSWEGMPTFPDWEAEVLNHTYELADYLSLHTYLKNPDQNRSGFLAQSIVMDRFIDRVVSTADFIKARKRSRKTMMLSFDEWNVWYHSMEQDSRHSPWTAAPSLLEDVYNFEDALVTACMINSLIRHADRVKIGCLAQLVNVIAPIIASASGCWRQTIYWPFYYASRYGRGTSMGVLTECPTYEDADAGDVSYLDMTATLDEAERSLSLFLVNRCEDDVLRTDVRLGGFEPVEVTDQVVMTSSDPLAVNDERNPDRIRPVRADIAEIDDSGLSIRMPPLSWGMVRIRV